VSQLPFIATNLLRSLGIQFSDIAGYSKTNRIEYLAPAMTLFYAGNDTITNIPYRTILFKRSVDGMPIAHRNYRINPRRLFPQRQFPTPSFWLHFRKKDFQSLPRIKLRFGEIITSFNSFGARFGVRP
jgi:hypothetical protein